MFVEYDFQITFINKIYQFIYEFFNNLQFN